MKTTLDRVARLTAVIALAGLASSVNSARADFAPPPDTIVFSTAACPGFAPDYPAFPDPIFAGDGGIDPAGQYLFIPTADVTLVREHDFYDANGDLSRVAYQLRINGTDSTGNYSLSGEFHSNDGPAPPNGVGQLRIVRNDGARMSGAAFITTISHRGDFLILGFSTAPRCSGP